MKTNLLSIILLILSLFSFHMLFAQRSISGNVMDKADNTKLEKATVVLLSAKDSILIHFKRTGEEGNFLLSNVDTGNYKLVVSYPQFADLIEDIRVDAENLNLGQLKLSKAARILEEIAITGKIPIVIKGDTIEYNADSFKVDKDAKVEDLLKVMPGITVDANGKITAQGKEVKKVLLEGEEFFGNDPTLITKNIRADMVDKVQVYEKKSDLTDRTGVDDGERSQTLNITLKENKKKGAFGQVLAGGGTDKYYGGKAMINKFNGAQKIAAYGIYANDGMVSLGFEDAERYGGGSSNNVSVGDNGDMFIMGGSSDDGLDSWSGSYYGNGVPKALNLGASYSDKFKGDKHKVNVSYRRGQIEVANNSTNFVQNTFPDNPTIQNSIGYSLNESKSDKANLRYDLKIDSLSDMTIRLGYDKGERDNQSNELAKENNLDETAINDIDSRNSSHIINENLNANLMLTRRFKKLKRSLTLNSNIISRESNGVSNYYSLTNFYQLNDDLLIDQLKNNKSERTNFNTTLSYTEPLSKKLTGTLGYTFNRNSDYTLNQSYDKNATTGVYDVLDQTLLNDFNNLVIGNSINAGLNYQTEKITINASHRFSFEDIERIYNNLNQELNRSQVTVAPALSLNYKLTKSKSIRASYSGNTLQPNLNQIEPLKQNANPLINYLDNRDLKSGFSNRFNISYNSYKQLKDISFYLSGYLTQNVNSIGSRVNYDPISGRRDIQFVNIDKPNFSSSVWGGYRLPIWKKIALSLNMGADVQYDSYNNYLALNNQSSELNKSESTTLSPSFGFNSYRADKWSFYSYITPGYRITKSTLQPELDNNNFVLSSYVDISYTFPKNYKIVLNMQQSYEAATRTLPSFSMVNMTGYVSKKFLKDKSLEAQIFVNDILNRNTGVRRYQYGYALSQTTNDVLRRYGMLKLIYNFTTMKGGE